MKKQAVIISLMLIMTGCSGEYAQDEAQRINTLSEEDNPEITISRDMLAAALKYDIDRFVKRNRPKLEVHKFSEWTIYCKDKDRNSIPGETFTLERIVGIWRVTGTRMTS